MVEHSIADALRAEAAAYYERKLLAHGPTPRGVDWNSESSQRLRFDELLRIIAPDAPAGTLIDYGCGYGALADHLAERRPDWRYCGFDPSPKMIEAARRMHTPEPQRSFTSDEATLQRAAYTVASGIFNVKFDHDDDVWTEYVFGTLDRLAALSEAGFAFNVLTIHSDPDRRRHDLYYADPLRVFEHCRQRFSRRVAILHDYPLFEFTILVRG